MFVLHFGERLHRAIEREIFARAGGPPGRGNRAVRKYKKRAAQRRARGRGGRDAGRSGCSAASFRPRGRSDSIAGSPSQCPRYVKTLAGKNHGAVATNSIRWSSWGSSLPVFGG